MNAEFFPAPNGQARWGDYLHRPSVGGQYFRGRQTDLIEDHRGWQIRSAFFSFQPPFQSGQRNSILAGKCSAGKTTAAELFYHLKPLIRA
jgi:hypothetical protein